jgi:hypothetical protein
MRLNTVPHSATGRRRRSGSAAFPALATALFIGAALPAALIAQDPSESEQRQTDRRHQQRIEEAHRREAEVLVDLADDAKAGRAVAKDFALAWRNDFLKAQPGTFVPFTVTIDRSDLGAASALMYVRAVRVARPGGTAAPDVPERQLAPKTKEKGVLERYAFDAIFPVDLGGPSAEPLRVSRGFAVPAGEYDVYITLRERSADPLSTRAGRLKASVLKQPLSVPDFWTDELTTSTVMLADRIEVLPQPLGPDESLERPYVIGQNDVRVAASSTFRKDRELIVVFVVYNPTVTPDRHFDIQVDYHLYYRVRPGAAATHAPVPDGTPRPREGERYVTRTDPQRFNPSVLGPRVDPGAGQPVMAGQGILLSSFQEGEYRLGITITDLLSRKTLSRDVTFTVAGS